MKNRDKLFHARKIVEEKEKHFLFDKASFSKDHQRLQGAEEDHRLPYKRDVDRILHSKAYSRYNDKTQVIYLVDNDHVTSRALHVQLVSSFARGIAEILRLNLDLVEAIALGHDVGHPPFGHEGEGYLSDLSIEYGNGPFNHPLQSCRLFSDIEPLNLGFAVYDGFLCHDGGMQERCFLPRWGKTWEDHFKERTFKSTNPDVNMMPATLEGCLVKLCDTMSYLSKDVEDAVTLGILQREEIPQTILGTTNREILGVIASDIIEQSYEKEQIAISQEVYEALQILRKFNFERIYVHPKLKVESKKIQKSYRLLFETLLGELQERREQSFIWVHFASKKNESYLSHTKPVQMVIDYISGMTDHFFVRMLEKMFVPSKIEL